MYVIGAYINLLQQRLLWVRLITYTIQIHPLFDPKQISLFCIWAMTSFYRRMCVCNTEHQPQSRPPRLLKPSHVMVLKKKPLPISLSFALSNLAVVFPVSVWLKSFGWLQWAKNR